jgi:hypothetical protein
MALGKAHVLRDRHRHSTQTVQCSSLSSQKQDSKKTAMEVILSISPPTTTSVGA